MGPGPAVRTVRAFDPRCMLPVVDDWPTRQTLRWVLAGTGIGAVLGLILRRRQTREVEGWASELGTLLGSRWTESEARDTAMLDHAQALRRLPIVVAVCTVISTIAVVTSAVLLASS
jgi:hypothetical protein